MYGLLGYSTEGVAWHSDDGKVYQRLPEQSEQVLGVAKDAARFVIGDTVGCGIDKEGDLFFTKNGTHPIMKSA
ncbi:hypothetical protein BJ508DRAFT_413042 [Ascobolus immersus RN42]|uniref:SPRY domain-containing protein n=1 Tax=Ascobolus immersus RN42 TaxID=1160509 RepID=A0A3N4ID22_ASCIM|nr:hypothetical protein BJ508DRAFT_413042 [Ascobolus immersus RN42]